MIGKRWSWLLVLSLAAPASSVVPAVYADAPVAGAAASGDLSMRARQRLQELVRDAESALRGDGEDAAHRAASLLAEAREMAPNHAGIAYNQGVAAWRAGNPEAARGFFREAAEQATDPALRARAAYNLGTAAHRSLLDGSAEAEDLRAAEALLEEAIEHYRSAISCDAADVDARANGEMAWRLLEELRAQASESTQSEPSDEPSSDDAGEDAGEDAQPSDPSDDSDDSDDSSGDQAGSPPPDDSSPDSGDSPPSQETEQDPASSPQDAEQYAAEEPTAPDPSDEEADADADAQPPPADDSVREEPQPATPREEDDGGISREEAERLLQIIRDSEARRRDELAARRRASAEPVERDW